MSPLWKSFKYLVLLEIQSGNMSQLLYEKKLFCKHIEIVSYFVIPENL